MSSSGSCQNSLGHLLPPPLPLPFPVAGFGLQFGERRGAAFVGQCTMVATKPLTPVAPGRYTRSPAGSTCSTTAFHFRRRGNGRRAVLQISFTALFPGGEKTVKFACGVSSNAKRAARADSCSGTVSSYSLARHRPSSQTAPRTPVTLMMVTCGILSHPQTARR